MVLMVVLCNCCVGCKLGLVVSCVRMFGEVLNKIYVILFVLIVMEDWVLGSVFSVFLCMLW